MRVLKFCNISSVITKKNPFYLALSRQKDTVDSINEDEALMDYWPQCIRSEVASRVQA